MLAFLGFAMVIVFIVLIMTGRMSPVAALIVLPLSAGLLAGQAADLGGFVVDGIESLAQTALLLVFAIMYFSLMIDVGLFDPVVSAILRFSRADPVRIAIGTVALTLVVSLDGDGSSTILIVAAAFLALYDRLGMSRVVLGVLIMLSIACTNITPWGGPVTRAAAALQVDPAEIFLPMVPSMAAAAVAMFGLAYVLGRRERARLQSSARTAGARTGTGVVAGSASDALAAPPAVGTQRLSRDTPEIVPERAVRHRRLFWFNVALTVTLMAAVVLEVWPLGVLFAVAFAIALVVNHRSPKEQAAQITGYAPAVIPVVSLIFAAAVFVGVLSGTGMIEAMGLALVAALPQSWGAGFGVLVGLLSLPLKFVLSNDAYYFGVVPVLAEAGAVHGLTPSEVGRAAIIAGPVHVLSPLVPALYLLVGRLDITLGELQRKGLPWAVALSVLMLAVALALGAIPIGAS
ncbi:hypothetical protein XF36_02640 [Pseudonocardia sp. HH130629-09]|nr:hypothetical protein XF36_02640 [Pseudonocardia sp. HH130629-09]